MSPVWRVVKRTANSEAISYTHVVGGAFRTSSVSFCWCLACFTTIASCGVSTNAILHPCCWRWFDITSSVYGMYKDKSGNFSLLGNMHLTYYAITFLTILLSFAITMMDIFHGVRSLLFCIFLFVEITNYLFLQLCK